MRLRALLSLPIIGLALSFPSQTAWAGSVQDMWAHLASLASQPAALDPVFEIPSPEVAAGCPVPTLEQCQQPGYLAGELDDPDGPACGLLQGTNEDWTCATLFRSELERYSSGPSIFAKSLAPSGVVDSAFHLPPASGNGMYFAGELTSPANSFAYGPSLFEDGRVVGPGVATHITAVDPRPYWGQHLSFDSCQEYAWQSYSELGYFWYALGADRHDPVRALELAFTGNGYAAIGKEHLDGTGFRDAEGNQVLPSERFVPRNAFVVLPKRPRRPGQSAVTGSPSLHRALDLYESGAGKWIVTAVRNARDKRVTKDMAWYEEYWNNMTVERRPPTVVEDPTWELDTGGGGGSPELGYHAPGEDGGDGLEAAYLDRGDQNERTRITGAVPTEFSEGKVMSRMFAAELDELYELQRKKDKLVREWAELDVHFEGSGWDIQTLIDEEELDLSARLDTGASTLDHAVAALPGGTCCGGSAIVAAGSGGGVGQGAVPTLELTPPEPEPYRSLSAESAARARVLDELIAVYAEAKQAGCLDRKPTPCDFSPAEFLGEAIPHAVEEQQAKYDECIALLPYPFDDNLGEERAILEADHDIRRALGENGRQTTATAHPNLHAVVEEIHEIAAGCVFTVPTTMTPAGLRFVQARTASCLDRKPAYHDKLAELTRMVTTLRAIQRAKKAVASIEQLVDPDTGELQRPGALKSWSQDAGNDYFGLEMGYTFGYDTKVAEDVCAFDVMAGGDLRAVAKVLKQPVELLEFQGWVRTDTPSVRLGVEYLGSSFFEGLQRDGASHGETTAIHFAQEGPGLDVEGPRTPPIPVVIGVVPITVGAGIAGKVGVRISVKDSFFDHYDEDYDSADSGTHTIDPNWWHEGPPSDPVPDWAHAVLDEDAQLRAQAYADKFNTWARRAEDFDLCPELRLEGNLGPYVRVEGFAEAAIDGVIASVGVRGAVTIVDAQVGADLDMGLAVDRDPLDMTFYAGMGTSAELTTLSGSIRLFAKLGRRRGLKAELPLVRWNGFSMDHTLFEDQYQISVLDLILAEAD